jgi:hypothetical protein
VQWPTCEARDERYSSVTDTVMFYVALDVTYIRPRRSVFYHILNYTYFPSMPYHSSYSSPNPYFQSYGRTSQGTPGYRSKRSRYAFVSFYSSQLASETRSPSSDRNIRSRPIFTIDDDSLLRVFYLYRLACLECDDDKAYVSESISGGGGWAREHWWCVLARVCRKWRYLILGSPSHLRLCIAYTRGKPVPHMLAHPPFSGIPLVIEYIHRGADNFIPTKYKQEITLALQHRGRVRRIRLHAPYSGTVFGALDGEFPKLECLDLEISNAPYSTWQPPRTFRTPCLRQVVLNNITCPLQSLLLTPAAGLVTLSLTEIGEHDNYNPNNLLQQLRLMRRLETLRIGFALFSSSPVKETQMTPPPIRVALPYLRRFLFNGTKACLGTLLPHISTPPLEKLQIYICDWETQPIPDTLKLMNRSENFRSQSVELMFLDQGVFVRANLFDGTKSIAFSISLRGNDLTWQVLAAAYFFKLHRECFFTTRSLTIHCRMPASRQAHAGPDRTQLRELFAEFFNVYALFVYDGPQGEISRSFEIKGRESGTELLPKLKQLSILKSTPGGACDPFIDARRRACCPVQLRFGKAPPAISVAIDCEAWEATWLWKSFRLRL